MDNKGILRIGLPTVIFFAAVVFINKSFTPLIPFAAAFLHELGHIAVMSLCGQKIKKITVLPFGVDIKKSHSVTSYKADIAVSSAGLAVNLAVFILCFFLPKSAWAEQLRSANLFLMAVNILPIKNLDGGQVIEKLLCLRLDPDTADRIINICSFFCLVVVGSVAVWLLMSSGYNFTLLFMCIYLFCEIFIKK